MISLLQIQLASRIQLPSYMVTRCISTLKLPLGRDTQSYCSQGKMFFKIFLWICLVSVFIVCFVLNAAKYSPQTAKRDISPAKAPNNHGNSVSGRGGEEGSGVARVCMRQEFLADITDLDLNEEISYIRCVLWRKGG